MKTFKVTTPNEMKADLSQLKDAINKFEAEWATQAKGESIYRLVISGELNKETQRKVTEIYRKAGWDKVFCQTSSENGERYGLTGLTLETNKEQ